MLLLKFERCICNICYIKQYLHRYLSAEAPAQTAWQATQQNNGLQQVLDRLDKEVRRTGQLTPQAVDEVLIKIPHYSKKTCY